MTDIAVPLPAEVGQALAAMAAVDGVDQGSLAGMIVADWLLGQAPRIRAAADALDRLAGASSATAAASDRLAEVTHDDAFDAGVQAHGPAEIAAETDPAPLACPEPGCGFVGRSPQSLSGHKGRAHRRCQICRRYPIAAGRKVDEVSVCAQCWRDAGRPA